jgi:alpha-ketoglutaric semialdehyde dehydrogenase
MQFKDHTIDGIDSIMKKAWDAFIIYRNTSLVDRASFMKAIAVELENAGDHLIQTAMQETNLPEARLRGERGRTIFQLNSYADACLQGNWLEATIDTAIPEKTPPKPDIRKMQVALGPVVVFGSSNFPFAYSTAGGDTASALAAGCPVIVKAHPAHPQTSSLVAEAILSAAKNCHMPAGVFAHVYGASFEIGKALVMHPHTKAVGFTGSFTGGKQLFDWSNQRKEPIPVFAEMGSVNPVFLMPNKLNTEYGQIASMYAGSITLGAGQFCTNPGLIIGIESEALQKFIHDLGKAIQQIAPAKMLHSGIIQSYKENKQAALLQEEVHLVAESSTAVDNLEALPTIATTTASNFLNNPLLHQEVFGPFSLVIRCIDMQQMIEVAQKLEGQLTATIMTSNEEFLNNYALVEAIKNICGRLTLNSVPTGVEVCLSMHHGGPYPASTDSRFGAVGADSIKRFCRPIAFQNWPDELLPAALKEDNPLNLWRRINNEPKKG